jgi:hypothetical protein
MRTSIEEQYFTANVLFKVEARESTPQHPACFRNRFIRQDTLPREFSPVGAGVYAIFFCDELIYVGKFLGSAKNPAGGNILRSRWDKHLGTLTMTGAKTSIRRRTLDFLTARYAKHSLTKALMASDLGFLLRDRGCVSTQNRTRFALENWKLFSSDIEQALRQFSFLYVKPALVPSTRISSFRKAIGDVEQTLIHDLRPRCNSEIELGTQKTKVRCIETRKTIAEALSCHLCK